VFAGTLRSFATGSYGPAAAAFIAFGQAAPAGLVAELVALTGASAALWNANLDLDPDAYRSLALPGQLMGRYDARIVAANGSALAASGDPSAALVAAPFAAAAQELFQQELLYSASADYTMLSDAISSWDFSHDGQPLPDTIPDLAAALVRAPALPVLSLAGYHDLATPFLQTELDLGRLGPQPSVVTRTYPGGHMIYLDDLSRGRLRDAMRAFLRGTPVPAQASATTPNPGRAPALRPQSGAAAAPQASTAAVLPAATSAVDRSALAQGGDPIVPPGLRVPPATSSPRGAELAARVREKIAAHDRDVYR
jgi:hypothetical protein